MLSRLVYKTQLAYSYFLFFFFFWDSSSSLFLVVIADSILDMAANLRNITWSHVILCHSTIQGKLLRCSKQMQI